MIINSPSGKRLADGKSMIPGSPKLLTVTGRFSSATAKMGVITVKKVAATFASTILVKLV